MKGDVVYLDAQDLRNKEFEELMDFSDYKIYFAMGLARPKNNPGITKNKRVFFRIPVRSPESYQFTLEKLYADCERTGLNMYIYVSVNARNTVKAYELFKKKMAEYENIAMHGRDDFKEPLAKLDKTWYSACMKQYSRGTKYYLLDIDTKDTATRDILTEKVVPLSGEPFVKQETRNGYHWIVKPFDVRVLEGISNVGVQQDGLLYLGHTGFKPAQLP